MIEESFLRLYAQDFSQLANRAELGQDVETSVNRRVVDARAHAVIMDSHKGAGHLPALAERLRKEALRFDGRSVRPGASREEAEERRRGFLGAIADGFDDIANAAPEPASGAQLHGSRLPRR